jgi:hypothetical protein
MSGVGVLVGWLVILFWLATIGTMAVATVCAPFVVPVWFVRSLRRRHQATAQRRRPARGASNPSRPFASAIESELAPAPR